MGETAQRVGTAIFWSSLAKTARFVLGLLSSIIVVRGLGEVNYGVLSLARTCLAFVVIIAGFGFGQALLKFLPALRVKSDVAGARRLLRQVVGVQLVIWFGLLAASYLFAGSFESLFGIDGIGTVLWIAVCLSISEIFYTLISQVLNAYYDTKLLSVSSIVSHVVFIVLLLVLMPQGLGVVEVLVAAATGHALASLIVLRNAFRHFQRTDGDADKGGIDGKRLARLSIPFALIGILNMVVWRQSETFFLAHYRGPSETGFFDLAYRLPQAMLEFIPGTVWPIVFAGFSEYYERNKENMRAAIERYYRMLFLLSAPVCLSGIALGGRVIPILFGDAMSPAALPTQIFFGIFTISFFGTPLSMALYVMEKSHINLLVYLVLAVINVTLDFLLIPKYGVIGAVVPVSLVIVITPFIYKQLAGRFIGDIKIPFLFIGKCFLASSPVLLALPLAGLIEGAFELGVALALAGVAMIFTFKKLKVIGKQELDLLSSVPIPAAGRLLKFISS